MGVNPTLVTFASETNLASRKLENWSFYSRNFMILIGLSYLTSFFSLVFKRNIQFGNPDFRKVTSETNTLTDTQT